MHFKLLFCLLATLLAAPRLNGSGTGMGVGIGAARAEEGPASASAESGPDLFNKEAMEGAVGLAKADCHLRNMDLCYTGLMAAGSKLLPEAAAELESRCDELKVAQLCLADYQARCSSQRDLATTMGLMVGQGGRLLGPASDELKAQAGNQSATVIDLMALCEPTERQRPGVQELRQRLFKAGACINAKMPALRPCIMDIKTALQLFFDQDRKLAVRPTCCALSRFRHCSRLALDGACGLSSLEQLESSFASVAGTSGRLVGQTMGRVCRGADQWQSDYCRELLPPAGSQAPQRRGRKASKLSRALDLLSMMPAN